jgi:hypothetical protein
MIAGRRGTKSVKGAKKVKSLRSKALTAKKSREVKGGSQQAMPAPHNYNRW